MNVTLQNLGLVPVPVVSSKGSGFLDSIEPGDTLSVNHTDLTVVSVGDNPSFIEEFKEGLAALWQTLSELLKRIAQRREEEGDDLNEHPTIVVQINNSGPNALRVLLGSNLDEVNVDVGAQCIATAPRYVEIRELGV